MKNIVKILALICVFFALTPGVLIRLPIKGGIYKIAALHALLFGVIYFIVTNVFGVLREGVQRNCSSQIATSDTCDSSQREKYKDATCKQLCSAAQFKSFVFKEKPTNIACAGTPVTSVGACKSQQDCQAEVFKRGVAQPRIHCSGVGGSNGNWVAQA